MASASGNLLVCAVMSGAVCEVLGGWAQGWSDVLVLPTSTSPDVRLFADAAKPMPITVAMAQKAMAGTVCDVVGGEMLLIDVVPAGSGVLDSAASMLFVVADATGQVTYRAFRASNAQQLATLSRAAVVEDGGGAASAARVVALQSARAAIQPAQQVLSGDAAKLHATNGMHACAGCNRQAEYQEVVDGSHYVGNLGGASSSRQRQASLRCLDMKNVKRGGSAVDPERAIAIIGLRDAPASRFSH